MESAWSYLVVSSARQAESLPDQRAWVSDAASRNGWEVTREFSGVSTGADGVRKIFEQLLEALERTAKRMRPARIMMIRLDRTGRGLGLDAIAAMAKIYDLGAKIYTRQDGEISIARTADTFGPVLRILAGAVENEARRDKAVRHYEVRRAQGKHVGSLAPYGTRLDEAGEPVAVEPQASLVRRVFELRAAGHGYRTIAQKLNAGSPPKLRRDGTERILKWHPSSIRYWVRCKTYSGVVVTEDLWKRANAVSNRGFRATEGTRYPWPLGGAIRCVCGKRLTGNPSKSNFPRGKQYEYRYYLCPDVVVHGGKTPRYRAEKLEAQIPQILRRIKGAPVDEKTYWRQRDKKRREIERRLRAAEERTVTLAGQRSHAWDQSARGGISDENLRRRLETLDASDAEARRGILLAQRELEALENSGRHERSLQAMLRELARKWNATPPDQQRSVANALARAVGGLVVDTDGSVRPFLDVEQDRLQI